MTAPDVFRRVVHALDAAGISYMLTGSFASAYHAVPRATQDIDLVIAPDRRQLEELARSVAARGVNPELIAKDTHEAMDAFLGELARKD